MLFRLPGLEIPAVSMMIGASVSAYVPVGPASRPSPAASAGAAGGGDIVALSVAAQSSLASSSLLSTLQQTTTALGSVATSIGTDLTV